MLTVPMNTRRGASSSTVRAVYSGYSPRELATLDTPEVRLHRAFDAR